jgi:hypothetical protein
MALTGRAIQPSEDAPNRAHACGAGFVRTEVPAAIEGKPLIELGLPKRPVPYWRIRPARKGISAAKEYRPQGIKVFWLDTGNYRVDGGLFFLRAQTSAGLARLAVPRLENHAPNFFTGVTPANLESFAKHQFLPAGYCQAARMAPMTR